MPEGQISHSLASISHALQRIFHARSAFHLSLARSDKLKFEAPAPLTRHKKEETFRSPLDCLFGLFLVGALNAVQGLEVVLLYDALELLAAVGAAEILGVDGGIEVDDVAASGADDLEVLVLILMPPRLRASTYGRSSSWQ